MRMRGGMSLVPLQEMHRTLWSIYLRLDADVAGGPQSLGRALENLCSMWTDVPRALPVVGAALWDLLRVYMRKKPPASFTTLLDEVLGLKLARARQLISAPEHAAFPPFASPMMSDSAFRVSEDGAEAELTVGLEANFDALSFLAQPEQWPRLCPLFWGSVRRNGDGWDGEWYPPTLEGTEPIPVRLKKQFRVADNTEAMANILVTPQGSSERARLLFDMRPEKPGWTRVTHRREVKFGPQIPPAYRKGTVAYWTKTELACLVLH
jgi:hypothetical protein